MRKEFNNTKKNALTSLEYSGLENLFRRIVSAYEDHLCIPDEDQTPVSEIIRRTENGIEVFDGTYNAYVIGDFAVKSLYTIGGRCAMSGFDTNGMDLKECYQYKPDLFLDITEFLDMECLDFEWLMEKIKLCIGMQKSVPPTIQFNRIVVKHPEQLSMKTNLSEKEYADLEKALGALIQGHSFIEYDETIYCEDYLQRVHTADFTGVKLTADDYDIYALEDYYLHSAYMTTQGKIIINAHPLVFRDTGIYMIGGNLQQFLVSGIDATCVSASSYACFVFDAPVPTVEL